jgi:predicted nucleic acid-binding protein
VILLDTNIVSETLRRLPDPAVTGWLDRQPYQALYLCTPVLAELLFGIERLQQGPRREVLQNAVARLEDDLYRDRILPFDIAAAKEYARIAAMRAAAGRIAGQTDTMIAAIAVTYRMTIATRNIRHFGDLELKIINPFELG